MPRSHSLPNLTYKELDNTGFDLDDDSDQEKKDQEDKEPTKG